MARKYVWILGPPLAGKTSTSKLIAQSDEHGHSTAHVSVGQLIRESTEHRDIIEQCFLEGKLIPVQLCFDILKAYLDNLGDDINLVVIDGYPRSKPCFDTWRSNNMPWPSLILHYKCSYDTLLSRLQVRSGVEKRMDDTVAIFRKRYHGYVEETVALISFLESLDDEVAPPCKSIDADRLLPKVLDKIHYYLCRYELCGRLTL